MRLNEQKTIARGILCVLSLVALLFAGVAGAEGAQGADAAKNVSSVDLIEKGKELDKTVVAYAGEAVGDVLARGAFSWVAVSDGQTTISVWAPTEDTDAITRLGSYDGRGDTVRVVGTYHRACAEHGGDLDIHAQTLDVTEAGHAVMRPYSKALLYGAGALVILALLMVFFVIRKRL
ncbi:MAG: DNA-binding protein [Clostridia bacterium]